MTNNSGLTLIETLMGLAILTISVLALVMLQQGVFSADAVTTTSRTAQRLAENELTAQLATPSSTTGSCLTQANIELLNDSHPNPDARYDCQVHIFNCGIVTKPSIRLDCSATAPNPPTHHLIAATLSSPHADDLTLTALRKAN